MQQSSHMTQPASLNLTDVSPFSLPGGSEPLDRNQRVSWPGPSTVGADVSLVVQTDQEPDRPGTKYTRNLTVTNKPAQNPFHAALRWRSDTDAKLKRGRLIVAKLISAPTLNRVQSFQLLVQKHPPCRRSKEEEAAQRCARARARPCSNQVQSNQEVGR